MIIIAPDSYKGCLNASAVASAMERGIREVLPNEQIYLFPMADGGEGTLDVILTARSGVRLAISVAGINGAPVNVAYGVIDSAITPTAVIEIAQIVGLPLAQQTSVASRTTTGIGELIIHCLDQGIRRFLIGLGGSGTNDAGVGLLHALGARIVHDQGSSQPPLADSLKRITSIDFSMMDPRIKQCEIILLTDVDNPLTGNMGATQTYGPQKGIAPDQLISWDDGMRHFGNLCDTAVGSNYSKKPGSGAAGGLGFAFQLLGAKHQSGARQICELYNFADLALNAEWILTGEGKSDLQTLHGKAPMVVAQYAKQAGVPVTLLSGAVDSAALSELSPHFDGCFSITPGPTTLDNAIAQAQTFIAHTAEQCARLFARTLH